MVDRPLTRDDVGIWLINLPRATARHEKMQAQLAALGLDYTLFEAVDGRARKAEFAARVDRAAYQRNMGTTLIPGHVGVYASHLAVWERLIASNHRVALILEDDVVFHDDFLDSLDVALGAAEHWDIVRFNCIRAKLPITQRRLDRYRLNAYVGPFTGNATYLIHREVAVRLLLGLWPQTRALDHELNRFFIHDFRLLGLEPWASHVDDGGESTITGRSFAEVRNFPKHKRVRYYFLKTGNYFRRAWWLLKRGHVHRSVLHRR